MILINNIMQHRLRHPLPSTQPYLDTVSPRQAAPSLTDNLALACPDTTSMDPEKTGSEGEEPLGQALKAVPGKEAHNSHDGSGSDIINGHLIELEVDLSRVICEDDVEGDWDADTSPFPAVRAVVPETDDPEMPVNTLRAWFLGIVSISRRDVLDIAVNVY